MGRYRMFIDESGVHSIKRLDDPANRYLGLLGVIFEDQNERAMIAAVNQLKRAYFGNTEVILHRDEILERSGSFQVLREDSDLSDGFDDELFWVLETPNYTAVCAIIDKVAHVEKYKVWTKEPYHYCLEILVERFVMFLNEHDGEGDMMIEARGKPMDGNLKRTYRYLFERGTSDGRQVRLSAEEIKERLTSSEIKIREKKANIAGLQFVDMLANPACSAARADREGRIPSQGYSGRLAQILYAKKYRRSGDGRVEGYGLKWLP